MDTFYYKYTSYMCYTPVMYIYAGMSIHMYVNIKYMVIYLIELDKHLLCTSDDIRFTQLRALRGEGTIIYNLNNKWLYEGLGGGVE